MRELGKTVNLKLYKIVEGEKPVSLAGEVKDLAEIHKINNENKQGNEREINGENKVHEIL
jgi:hypothetical protein